MDRKTRVVETVRDRKAELFLGAVALGGVGIVAANRSRGNEDDPDEGDDDPAGDGDDDPAGPPDDA